MPRKKAEAPKVSETKKKPAVKKPAATTKKPTTKPKATTKKPAATTKKPTTKPKATTKKPVATKKPATRRKTTTKPKEPTIKWKEIPLDELHPFEGFPYRLEYQDGNDRRTCHFECESHRTKHITRYKLNPKTIRLNYKYD